MTHPLLDACRTMDVFRGAIAIVTGGAYGFVAPDERTIALCVVMTGAVTSVGSVVVSLAKLHFDSRRQDRVEHQDRTKLHGVVANHETRISVLEERDRIKATVTTIVGPNSEAQPA